MRPCSPAPAWWSAGEEHCQFCHELYLLEAEVRCVECDRGVCPMCAIIIHAEAVRLCPQCQAEANQAAT